MSAAVSAPDLTAERIALRDMSWDVYELLLLELERQQKYLTYDGGSLELMSPAPEHERAKKAIASLIEILALERNIPFGHVSPA